MYNLFVTAQEDAWNKSIFEIDKSRCVVEYSDDEIVEEFGGLSQESIEKAQSYITLFCYEDHCRGNPKIGYLKSISMKGRTVKIRFEAQDIDESFTTEKIKEIDDQLDFHGGELNRTHWAIKNIDLVEALQAADISVSELMKLRNNAGLGHLKTLIEFAEYFESILISRATGQGCDPTHYKLLRNFFLFNSAFEDAVPDFIRKSLDAEQYWQFIKYKFAHYNERRDYLKLALAGLLNRASANTVQPSAAIISESLKQFDFDTINLEWKKALNRSGTDPSGAITIARTLLESVCKHILEKESVQYDHNRIELNGLYREVAKTLNLIPENHKDLIYKQILGGCSSIVNGLGTLRNEMGDAHGKGIKAVKPKPRHAELAVNLSGAMASFLIQTHTEKATKKAKNAT